MVMFARHCNYRAVLPSFQTRRPMYGSGVCTQVLIRLLCQDCYTSVVHIVEQNMSLSDPTTAYNQDKLEEDVKVPSSPS